MLCSLLVYLEKSGASSEVLSWFSGAVDIHVISGHLSPAQPVITNQLSDSDGSEVCWSLEAIHSCAVVLKIRTSTNIQTSLFPSVAILRLKTESDGVNGEKH